MAPTAAATPDLAALRASDAFLAFAEPARSITAPTLAHYANFSAIVGEERVEWTNKEQLWRDTAMAIRDEALLLGPEATRPMWDTNTLQPAALAMAWSDETTGGSGQFVEFQALYDLGGQPVERIWGLLIDTVDGAGVVTASMPPFDVAEPDAPDYIASRDLVSERMWAWVQSQPVHP